MRPTLGSAYIQRGLMDCRRVELVRMDDPAAPPAGTMGTVVRIGALGDLEVEWDDG